MMEFRSKFNTPIEVTNELGCIGIEFPARVKGVILSPSTARAMARELDRLAGAEEKPVLLTPSYTREELESLLAYERGYLNGDALTIKSARANIAAITRALDGTSGKD